MKTVLLSTLFMALMATLCGCGNRHCEAFDMKYAMFVPANMKTNDTLILYSNMGDSTMFIVSHKKVSTPYEYDINQNRGCQNSFDLDYTSTGEYFKSMSYDLYYSNNDVRTIDFNFAIRSLSQSQLYSLKLYPRAEEKVTVTYATIMDSVTLNKKTYKNVIVIEDSEKPVTKIHLSKKEGVVCITENSGREWTLTKW
jgi:hypothetical protein